jgi:hypothetical protein
MDCVLVGRYFLGGVIVVSHDRGVTWTRTEVSSTPLTHVTSKTWTSGSTTATTLIATSSSKILYSSDASTWTPVSVTGPLMGVAIGSNGRSK